METQPKRGDLWSLTQPIRGGDEVLTVLVTRVHGTHIQVAAVHTSPENAVEGDWQATDKTVPWPVIIEHDLRFCLQPGQLRSKLGAVNVETVEPVLALPLVGRWDRRWDVKVERGKQVRALQWLGWVDNVPPIR